MVEAVVKKEGMRYGQLLRVTLFYVVLQGSCDVKRMALDGSDSAKLPRLRQLLQPSPLSMS